MSSVLLYFLMGVLFAAVAASAWLWARDLGLSMPWWKWLLAMLWYGLLLLTVAATFTLIGEGEKTAGLRVAGALGVITIILGAGLARLVASGRHKAAAKGS